MKKVFFFSVMVVWCWGVGAQNRANIWATGTVAYPFIQAGIDFNAGVADTFRIPSNVKFFVTDAGICDTSGQLLFYTNGIYISNKNYDTLSNSVDFNPGWSTDTYQYSGHGFSQGCLTIPLPNSDSLYWIFNVTGEMFFAHGSNQIQPLHLSCSLIDISLDNGLGGIVVGKKNIYCINDTVSQGRLTACKHANGRDWWVIAHKYYSDIFYKLLVTPDSIQGPYEQQVGSVYSSNDILGMAVFSPDGGKYVTVQNDNSAEIYDFDRCTGEFSNPVTLTIPDSLFPSLSLGGAFSPSSRFLYLNTYKKIWQYDTWVSDIENSKILISEWDSSLMPFQTWFFLAQTAGDNKIYLSTYNSCRALHVISEPDSFGISCNVIQNGLTLPDSTYNFSVPNFPNYDLGRLLGSPCDTLTSLSPIVTNDFNVKLSPNPSPGWINIEYSTTATAEFELMDIAGEKRASITLYPYFKNRLLNLSSLPPGIYLWRVTRQGSMVASGKVAVVR